MTTRDARGDPASNEEIVRDIDADGILPHGALMEVIHAMGDLSPGKMLEIVTDDPFAPDDIPSWAREVGHAIEMNDREGKVCRFLIRKRS